MSAPASGGTPLSVGDESAYLVNDIEPAVGSLSIVALSREDVTLLSLGIVQFIGQSMDNAFNHESVFYGSRYKRPGRQL
ncbi:hypothetical protein MARA_02570 (plasmid) [Mycolicibacterium arabiense]|uniref:Uncharacterized protein n=2 Tax=Mycolicibacterium arabiense TaxID=1286181 RepID=A0A7I7RQN0_9MYCO|nr:hypothetical protein MARA_02570 [Mycolicibacterium arabiense]